MTVIGLVLVAKYGKNVSLAEEEEEHTESDDTDDEVDRGYKKSYKNEGILEHSQPNSSEV